MDASLNLPILGQEPVYSEICDLALIRIEAYAATSSLPLKCIPEREADRLCDEQAALALRRLERLNRIGEHGRWLYKQALADPSWSYCDEVRMPRFPTQMVESNLNVAAFAVEERLHAARLVARVLHPESPGRQLDYIYRVNVALARESYDLWKRVITTRLEGSIDIHDRIVKIHAEIDETTRQPRQTRIHVFPLSAARLSAWEAYRITGTFSPRHQDYDPRVLFKDDPEQ